MVWVVKYWDGKKVKSEKVRFDGDNESLYRKLNNLNINHENVIEFREIKL